MKTIKLVIRFILLICVLQMVICGCSDPQANTPQTTTAQETTTVAVTEEPIKAPELEAVAYNRDINIVYYKNSTWKVMDVSITENSGDVLENAIYERNLKAEEKYKINIVPTELAGSKIVTAVETDVLAGDINYDIIMPQMSDSMKLAVKNLLLDVNTLDYNDYSMPWWNNGIMTATAVNGVNYFAMGDMNLSDYDGTPIVLFNKDVITNFNLENPYDIVRNGGWTLDKMIEMSGGITNDLNADGTMNEADRYGVSTNNFAVDIFVYGCDISFARNDGTGGISFDIDDEKLMGVIEKISLLLSEDNAYLADRYGSNNQVREKNTQSIFADNRALFFPSLLQAVSVLRGGGNEFGILPTPKYNSQQESYVSYVHLYTGTTICIQKNYRETEMVSRIIEDMTYDSYKGVIPVYVDIALKSKQFRDEESGEMLNIVFDSYTCDLANVIRGAGLTLGNDLRDIVTNRNNNVASLLAANRTVYENTFNSIIGKLGN